MSRRLQVFARGNVDVHDALVVAHGPDGVAWNGINTLLRERGVVARVVHETAVRSDVLAILPQPVPEELAAREPALELGAFPLARQFATQLYDGKWDAIVLSIMQDAMTGLLRHRSDGWQFFAGRPDLWTNETKQWARASLERVSPLSPAAAAAALQTIVHRIRTTSDAPILVFNASTYVPGEDVHCHAGLDELLSARLMQFNLALVEVSRSTGISIVDVDRILAGAGAHRLKIDALHCTAEGYELVCREVVRVMAELGLLDAPA